METTMKTVWRMGVRDKKDWNKWTWSKEYDSFEDLMKACSPWLKENVGRVTRIITRNVFEPVKTEGAQ